MTSHFMPVRGERSTPTFDHDQPSTLRQYLAQLDRLFVRCKITSSLEKRDFATSFLKNDITDCWEALPEFIDPAKTYAQFTYQLLNLYNQTIDRYTIDDLVRLASDHVQTGIRSLQDLGAFHL